MQKNFLGVVNLNFKLPHYPVVGTWKILVVARSQIQEKTFEVEHYFTPRFEVRIFKTIFNILFIS